MRIGFSHILVWALIVLAGRIYAAPIEITSPQPGTVINTPQFELAWRSDPALTGASVKISIQTLTGQIIPLTTYDRNTYENRLTLDIPNQTQEPVSIIIASEHLEKTVGSPQSDFAHVDGITFSFAAPLLTVSIDSVDNDIELTVHGDPLIVGTVLRFELRQSGGGLIETLGTTFDHTLTDQKWTTPLPHVARGVTYFIRVVSVYRQTSSQSPSTWDSSNFVLTNVQPYIQVLVPNGGGSAIAYPGTMSVLWTCLPDVFGTSARIELWRGTSFVMTLGYKFDCGVDNSVTINVPAVPSGTNYKIRVVSAWLESNPVSGIPVDDFSDGNISIDNSGIVLPFSVIAPSGGTWSPNTNGMFSATWTSDPTIVGTAVRLELLNSSHQLVKVLGIANNAAINEALLPDPKIQASSRYFLRIVSIWLEGHPSFIVPYAVESPANFAINSKPAFSARQSMALGSPSSLLGIAWHSEWQNVGTAFRVQLHKKSNPSGPQIDIGNLYIDMNDPEPSLPVDISPATLSMLASGETSYNVRLTSYWLEQIHAETPYIDFPDTVSIKPGP